MPGMIILSDQEAATNADIFQGTRLQTFPSRGRLILEMQAADADATNNFQVSLQLPDGRTPMNGVLIPGTATAGLAGILDDRLALQTEFIINQGGHAVFSCVETGDTEFTWRATFLPG